MGGWWKKMEWDLGLDRQGEVLPTPLSRKMDCQFGGRSHAGYLDKMGPQGVAPEREAHPLSPTQIWHPGSGAAGSKSTWVHLPRGLVLSNLACEPPATTQLVVPSDTDVTARHPRHTRQNGLFQLVWHSLLGTNH